MNLEPLATPIYLRAMAYLTALHLVLFVGACLANSLLLAASAIAPFIAALPGSLISLAVFKIMMARVNPGLSLAEAYNSVHIKALGSLAVGAFVAAVVVFELMDLPFITEAWWYLLVPAFATWLAVFQKRTLIKQSIQQEQNQPQSCEPQSQSPNQSLSC